MTECSAKLERLLNTCSKAENQRVDIERIERKELDLSLKKKYPYMWERTKTTNKKALSMHTQLRFEQAKQKSREQTDREEAAMKLENLIPLKQKPAPAKSTFSKPQTVGLFVPSQRYGKREEVEEQQQISSLLNQLKSYKPG